MSRLDALMIRHLLMPAKSGLGAVLGAIAACEVRTMGMGLGRSDGRNAGALDPVLLHLANAILPIV